MGGDVERHGGEDQGQGVLDGVRLAGVKAAVAARAAITLRDRRHLAAGAAPGEILVDGFGVECFHR